MQVLVVPLPSAESHTFVMVKVVQELAARGHQVLVIHLLNILLRSNRPG